MLTENIAKITTPCAKNVFRLYSKDTGKAIADVLTLENETIPEDGEYEIFDPEHTWKRKTITDYTVKNLLVPIFEKGKCVYTSPSLLEIKNYCKEQIDSLWDEVKRFENPHTYYVDLSDKLWRIKTELLSSYNNK